jgi:hypothetical protein
MPYVPVTNYQADWNPAANKYRILVSVAGSPQAKTVPVNSETEYVAILLMLGKAGVTVDTATGSLQIPKRPVGT